MPPSTPAQLGFRMPAEWEVHDATWLTWPRREGISFPDRYDAIPPVYAQLIESLVQHEDVNINVWDEAMESEARESLTNLGTNLDRVSFHRFPSYEPWCRDHGPIFLVRDRDRVRERAVVDWRYNAWGNKYPPFDLDDRIPARIAHLKGLPLFQPPMILEGGSIDVNGRGTLLTTESCLLNPNRNPTLSRYDIEQFLKDFLGVTQILWLGDGIAGDDTDGHIDDLSRFVDPRTIVTAIEHDPDDENHDVLKENLMRLRSFKDQEGKPFRIATLPMPGRVDYQGDRLPASYANFYIANEQVVVPTYRHSSDTKAIEVLQGLFPSRKVVGIDSTDLVWGLGSFHCITQQEPAENNRGEG